MSNEGRIQEINDQISILLDEWWEHDHHFDSERLHKVYALREEREELMQKID